MSLEAASQCKAGTIKRDPEVGRRKPERVTDVLAAHAIDLRQREDSGGLCREIVDAAAERATKHFLIQGLLRRWPARGLELPAPVGVENRRFEYLVGLTARKFPFPCPELVENLVL